jgi:hypothetical protein
LSVNTDNGVHQARRVAKLHRLPALVGRQNTGETENYKITKMDPDFMQQAKSENNKL